ncbi:MAG: sigma-54 dependent transcriptional regulator [Candidatus Neomarinimicrobiota bacterium]
MMNFILAVQRSSSEADDEFLAAITSGLEKVTDSITVVHSFTSILAYAAIEKIGAIWLDLRIIQKNAEQFFKRLKKLDHSLPVIVFITNSRINTSIMVGGELVFDLLPKNKILDNLPSIMERISTYSEIQSSVTKDIRKILNPRGLDNFVGSSAEMLEIYKQIIKVSESDFTTLILGQSGSGKELVAQTIHKLSSRSKQAFVILNCAAIPQTLQESELFGFEKGAFTGAEQSKAGKFEMADKGTLFLDEVGDMDLDLQAKLLRVLEDKTIERLGGTSSKIIDVRILSATNMDLPELIRTGQFRADLYHRLNVIPIKLKPLKLRERDIILLAIKMLGELMKSNSLNIPSVSLKILQRMKEFPLLGNVRELENILTRMLFYSKNGQIDDDTIDQVKDTIDTITDEKGTQGLEEQSGVVPIPIWKLEKIAIEKARDYFHGNLSRVAEELEISRSALYRKMKKYELTI